MRTFRGELKKRLIEAGYPVEISKFFANGRIRNLGRDIIYKEGIKIKRERISEYQGKYNIDRYVESITVFTQGYIDDETIKEIVQVVYEDYVLPYGITSLHVTVYNNDDKIIYSEAKRKNLPLNEWDSYKLTHY